MKTSAQNQFIGTVKSIDLAPVSAQVVVELPGGAEIVATMTRSSAERLDARPGLPAIALIKASAVVIVTDFDGHVLSARNQLAGTVASVERGAVSSLVVVDLPSGQQVCASVTHHAVEQLGLAPGVAATAVFKAYAVMLAVKST